MKTGKWMLGAFIVLCLVQWAVPVSMILSREKVLTHGMPFKFKTAPVDPNDPFRGKYIILNFEDNQVAVPTLYGWHPGQDVYVTLTTQENGMAKIENVFTAPPHNGKPFVQARINTVASKPAPALHVDFPFDRLYLEESKASVAEDIHRVAGRDSTKLTYALVYVKEGNAELQDVFINGKSIVQLARERQR